MKEHIYIAKPGRIIKQTIFIWLYVAIQIAGNIMTIPALIRTGQVYSFLIVNVFLSLLTIPSVQLFFNYYKYAANKKFIVTYNSLMLIDEKTGRCIELKNMEIEKVVFVHNPSNSRFPWSDHEFFFLTDAAKNTIVVNSYIMGISEFWMDSLARRVSSNKLSKIEKYFPLIGKKEIQTGFNHII
jgi:hypothetical protein